MDDFSGEDKIYSKIVYTKVMILREEKMEILKYF